MNNHKRTIRTLSHCFYDLKYHIVWTPKYRGKVLTSNKVKDELRRIFESICKWKHWEIIELSIQADHIHLCVLLTPRDSVSYAMQIIKSKLSAWMKKKIKRQHGLYERQSLWARGYFVSTIGLNEYIVRRYVKHQNHRNEVSQPSLFTKLTNQTNISALSGTKPAIKQANPMPPALKPVVVYFMARRSIEQHNIRKLTKVGRSSYAVTIPIELAPHYINSVG